MITIRRWSTGAAVLRWQNFIKVPLSCVFDQETETATRAWQSLRGLEADGVVGPKTWAAAGYVDSSLAILDDGNAKLPNEEDS